MRLILKPKKTTEAEVPNFVSSKRNKSINISSPIRRHHEMVSPLGGRGVGGRFTSHKLIFATVVSSVVVVFILSIVQITAYNSLSTQGIELSKVQHQIAIIQKENINLREQLYTASAYNTIAPSAEAEGFIEAKTPIVFVDTPQPLAIRQ